MTVTATRICPRPIDLSRAFHDDDARIVEHVATCASCQEAWHALTQLRDAARALPSHGLEAHRRMTLRTRVLDDAYALGDAPRRWTRWLVVAGLVAAAAAVVVATPSEPAHVAPLRAQVFASPGAELVQLAPDDGDEIVRLRRGTVTVEVGARDLGPRLRVVTAHGEVEASGAVFEVEAQDDRVVAVRALSGRVVLRTSGTLTLEAGETWSAPIAPAPIAPVRQRDPRPTKVEAPVRDVPVEPAPGPSLTPGRALPKARRRASESPLPRTVVDAAVEPPRPEPVPSATPAELAFQAGWSALRAGDGARAARELARVPADSALGEDAAFWRGIALTRAGQSSAASQVLAAFIRRYPGSAHVGNASVALGWLHLSRGDHDAARTAFTVALRDADPAVRASAERGLARLVAPD